ncbi:hypothetical protein PoB_001314900 [Plakobranchus ocellatus]|uniref:Uncharacterized protein n=1 Tax=Plakobranchus ocellatus TaxID=259542 RepID=A0AAV3YX47_9GAST|nr:hypothetical protein PoB_001314900 [Plakobranchus ocellatus]
MGFCKGWEINPANPFLNIIYNIWRSVGSSGRAAGYQERGPRLELPSRPSEFFIAILSPPSTKWVARSLSPGESKGGEESNGKLPHNAVCQEQSELYSWFPDTWTGVGPIITFISRICQ